MNLQKILEDRDHPIWSFSRSIAMAAIIAFVMWGTAEDYSTDDKMKTIALVASFVGGEGFVKIVKLFMYGKKEPK